MRENVRKTFARAFIYCFSATSRLPPIDANIETSWRNE